MRRLWLPGVALLALGLWLGRRPRHWQSRPSPASALPSPPNRPTLRPRRLGQAFLLPDEPGEAAEALSAYVGMRVENPLGWWEPGLAYGRLAQ